MLMSQMVQVATGRFCALRSDFISGDLTSASTIPDAGNLLRGADDPVIGRLSWHERGISGRTHSHPRAQLVQALAAPAEIRCAGRVWAIGPGEAVWLPGGLEHSVSARQAQLFHSVYIRPDLARGLPDYSAVVSVDHFVSGLIERLTQTPHLARDAQLYAHLAPLLLHELVRLLQGDPDLPLPLDLRARRICQSLLANPGDRRTLADWAIQTGASRRLLERLFRAETGIGFIEWRQACRVRAATPLLLAGQPVQQVAWKMGYDSPSAFTAMYRRATGITPASVKQRGS
jgi:AraC-like DNA-binding protein